MPKRKSRQRKPTSPLNKFLKYIGILAIAVVVAVPATMSFLKQGDNVLGASTATLSLTINSSTDDATQYDPGGMDLTSQAFDMLPKRSADSRYGYVGLRFNGVSIPKGSKINNARIRFYPYVPSISGTSNYRITVEKSSNPITYASDYYNITNRPHDFDTGIRWTTSDTWTKDNPYYTSDISSLVQEQVNKSDWVSGNSIAFLIDGDGVQRKVASYDSAYKPYSPTLEISYAAPAPTPTLTVAPTPTLKPTSTPTPKPTSTPTPTSAPTPTPTPVPAYAISGVVFVDSSKDGKRQPSEKGYVNAGITLTKPIGYSNTKTAAYGVYRFTADSGSYAVSIKVPAGYKPTTPTTVKFKLTKNATFNFGITK